LKAGLPAAANPLQLRLGIPLMITTTELRKFAEGYTAAWCSHDAARVSAFYSAEGWLRINEGDPAVGRSAIAQAVREFMMTFPDLQVILDDFVVDNENAVYRWTLFGSNTGPGGTGKRVQISGFEEWRIGPDGLIAESRGHFDSDEYKRQITEGVNTQR